MIKLNLPNLLNSAKRNLTKRKTIQDCLIIIVIFCISFVSIINSPNSIWRKGSDNIDTWVFQTVAYTMQNGGAPYVDSFDHKGPLLFLINYLGLTINFDKGVWFIELLFVFATFLVLYKIARLFCRKITALLSVGIVATLLFSFIGCGNYTEEYAMLFIAIAIFVFLDFYVNHKISKLRWALCGASLACVCMLRLNMISIWMVFCTTTFFYLINHKKWQTLKHFMIYFIGGFLAITLPIIIWLAMSNALVPCFEQYILFNIQYSTDDTRATNENRWNALFRFCKPAIISITLLISGWICCQKSKQIKTLGIIYSTYLGLSLLLICISGQTYEHYGMVLVPAVVFPISYIISCIEKHTKPSNYYVISAIGLYILATLIMPAWLTQIKNAGVHYKHRHESQIDKSVQKAVDYISATTPEGSKITVYGNMDVFYILSHRLPASKYSYQAPIGRVKTEIMDEYFDDLGSNQPAAIIIKESANGNFQLDTQRMKDFLAQNKYTCDFEVEHEKGKLLVCEK